MQHFNYRPKVAQHPWDVGSLSIQQFELDSLLLLHGDTRASTGPSGIAVKINSRHIFDIYVNLYISWIKYTVRQIKEKIGLAGLEPWYTKGFGKQEVSMILLVITEHYIHTY